MTPDPKMPREGEPKQPERQPSSPYGPQPYGIDESAGGADSSPFEDEPTGDRKEQADENRNAGRPPQEK